MAPPPPKSSTKKKRRPPPSAPSEGPSDLAAASVIKKTHAAASASFHATPGGGGPASGGLVEVEDLSDFELDVADDVADDVDPASDEGGRAEDGNPKVLHAKALEKARRKQQRRGVVYLGKIPPHMKPQKLRQLLSPYGDLDRMYLTPEDPAIRLRRKKFGGNTGKNFTEGWVEFRDKKKARAAAEMLNGQQIGGKRRSAYYSDLWNIRYLPKFKWENLTEEIEYQKALREQKLQLELSVAKKERDFYLAKVEQSKQIQKMQERREREAAGVGLGGGDDEGPPLDREETREEYEARMAREKARRKEDRNALLRRFKQRSAIGDVNLDEARGMLPPDLLRELFSGSSAPRQVGKKQRTE